MRVLHVRGAIRVEALSNCMWLHDPVVCVCARVCVCLCTTTTVFLPFKNLQGSVCVSINFMCR